MDTHDDWVYRIDALSEEIRVFEDSVVIILYKDQTFPGVTGRKVREVQTIPMENISGVVFSPGGLLGGYLDFAVPGTHRRPWWSPLGPPNRFRFSRANMERALEVKGYVERRVQELRNAPIQAASPVQATSPSLAEELQKLADLKAKDVLSDEEFQAAKRRLLKWATLKLNSLLG